MKWDSYTWPRSPDKNIIIGISKFMHKEFCYKSLIAFISSSLHTVMHGYKIMKPGVSWILTSSSISISSSFFSFCLLTNLSMTENNDGEMALKYLWKPHLTAKAAKILLLTSADLKSVRMPGEYFLESSNKCRVMT